MINASVNGDHKRMTKVVLCVSAVLVLAIVFGCGCLMFTGDIELKYEDTSFTIEASYWKDRTVAYADVEDMEYREQFSGGSRVNGFGSSRLLMGAFKNDEFGRYTRYTYAQCEPCIVLTVEGQKLVINGSDEKHTEAIYQKLLERKIGDS